LLILSEAGSHMLAFTMVGVAALGYVASRYIPHAEPASPQLRMNWNIAQETWRIIANDRRNVRVFRCILGISWFWLVGATFLSQFPTYAKEVLHADETVVTLFLVVFSLGIGAGSFLCNALLKGQVKSTYVPIAALGITAFTIDLFFASSAAVPSLAGAHVGISEFLAQPSSWRILFDLCGIAISGGVYVVPLYAILQHDSDPASRSRTIASNNIVNAVFMVAAAFGTMAMLQASFSVPAVFLTMGLLNGLVALYTTRLQRS